MIHFEFWQYILLALIFIWTGFIRTGIGFGGAALSLPFMLLLLDKPLFWLPIIAWHVLFFSSLTVSQRLDEVDWRFLRYTHSILIIPKIIGIFGLYLTRAQFGLLSVISTNGRNLGTQKDFSRWSK
jgi:uncharacterized membrane protein YfcA